MLYAIYYIILYYDITTCRKHFINFLRVYLSWIVFKFIKKEKFSFIEGRHSFLS